VALARVERERDEARAHLADALEERAKIARAVVAMLEALRLAETTRDAAQAIATRETELRRDVEERLQRHDDGVEGFIRYTGLRRDLDAMRELAWSWCIRAAEERSMRDLLNVLRQPDEQPIESLGPVPVSASHMADMSDGYTVGVSREMRTLAWLVRDAVRRGAKLQGGE
jgi:hypothetical protein